ncbi:MAG: hypothetical protein ABFR82_13505 [Nitrospirota bacterium]
MEAFASLAAKTGLSRLTSMVLSSSSSTLLSAVTSMTRASFWGCFCFLSAKGFQGFLRGVASV